MNGLGRWEPTAGLSFDEWTSDWEGLDAFNPRLSGSGGSTSLNGP